MVCGKGTKLRGRGKPLDYGVWYVGGEYRTRNIYGRCDPSPPVVVTDGGETLTEGVRLYGKSYSKNTDVGRAVVTIGAPGQL